ncbi:retrovirus-related pol polyprotein from transposon TNT 1-94, partial [Tanacetum coccineum]
LRIEQYFQVQDYALWDVIENGNSFKLVHQTTTNDDGSSTLLIPGPVTTEEKVQKKNDVKERSFRRLNKPYLDIMSFDDLYNYFKIVEQEVKVTTSSSSSSQNMAFVSSPSSTNEEFQQPEFEGYGPKPSKSVSEDTSNEVKESLVAPLVEELVSDDKLERQPVFYFAKMEFVRPKQQEKPVRKPIKYAEMYRSQSPRGNQRNWNNKKSEQLGSDFVMYNKACFVYGSFDHVQANCNYHQRERVVSGNNYTRVNYNYSAKKTHPSAQRNMFPRAVLMKTCLRSLNTARPVNIAHPKTIVYSARPMSHFSKSAQSTFDGKSDEGFFIGYSLNSKAFRVNNIRTRKVEENLHIRFLEDKPIIGTEESIGGSDAENNDDEGVCKKSRIADQEKYENSTQDVNTAGPMEHEHITTAYPVPSTPNTRIHKDHSLDHVIGKTHEELHTCLFACFLSYEEPKRVIQALKDPSWIEAMQEELLQFKLQQVWTLVDLPHGIKDHWVNKVARIEAIRLFLAYASFKDFIVYQMDVKSAFLYGKIEEEVYVYQPLGFEDPEFPDRVYKVEKAL